MQGQPNDFWGKLSEDDQGRVVWHPLADHCADVAAVCEALLERSLLRRRLARLAPESGAWHFSRISRAFFSQLTRPPWRAGRVTL